MEDFVDGDDTSRPRSFVNHNKIERVIADYVRRMAEKLRTGNGSAAASRIDCPSCGRNRSLVYRHGWLCIYLDCSYQFPGHLAPLSPREFEDLWHESARTQRLASMLKRADIELP